jgi:uncharacterized repeat protein (TIGR01451 family)
MSRYARFAIQFAVVATVVIGMASDTVSGQSRAADAPELSLTAEAWPETVVTGSIVTYTLEVTNLGPGIATDVVVVDDLPRETTFVSCKATGTGTCGGSGRTRRIRFDALMPDVPERVTLVATVMCQVRDGEELENTAALHGSSRAGEGDQEDGAENESVFVTASNPPPVIVEPTLTPSLPWPADQGIVNVTVGYQLRDNCGADRVVLEVSRTDDVDAGGAAQSGGQALASWPRDWEIVDAHHVRLRADRAAPASRRIFSVWVTAIDSANQSSGPHVMTLTVPARR